MWTSLSTSRCVYLVTLAAVILLSASEVVALDSHVPIVGLSCCLNVSSRRIPERIKECYEQEPRFDCRRHAFRIITKRNKEWCVNPTAKWLKQKREQGKLACRPELEVS